MNLSQLQIEVAEWSAKNFKNKQKHQPLLGVAEEVGELCHAHIKHEQGVRGERTEHELSKIDAIGDIVIYLADYCEHNDIDLSMAVSNTWEEVKKRDWTKNKKDGKV